MATMKRREFLKATLVAAGGLYLGACGTGDDVDPEDLEPQLPDPAGPDDDAQADTFFPQSVASGDPRADSVILWTRLADAGQPDADLSLVLQVARDEAFAERIELDGSYEMALTAEAAFDHCVKVRLTGLEPGTHYFYRFAYDLGDEMATRAHTRIARTKTAAAADSDTPVRLAFVSCQDINGRYFNPYKRMLRADFDDLDVIVHLGDYVYETTGDRQFQDTAPSRVTTFRAPNEAIVFNEGTDDEYFAAKSLGNYRDLYRFYRRDEVLQAIHERFPMVCIWDDHEFSDDCYGATATYFDGRVDETDVERRKNANQAWFEYMPVDYASDPAFRYDPEATYPDDIRIYRHFTFGQHLDLVMTDLRTYRADHVVPEDAIPGQILMTQADLEAALGEVPAWADPYTDIDQIDNGALTAELAVEAEALGYTPEELSGVLSATFVNRLIATINESRSVDQQVAIIDEATLAGYERGLSYLSLNKSSHYGQLGSRYLVVAEPFDVWAARLYEDTSGASEDTLGSAQEQWFLERFESSTSTWKLWGTEYTLTPRSVDLSAVPTLDDFFRRRFHLSVEDWDGNPNRRDQLVDRLADVGNVVAITGDIHAFFAGNPLVSTNPAKRIVEFVTAGISSASYRQLLRRTATSDPDLAAAGAGALALGIDGLLLGPDTAGSPALAYADTGGQGFAVIELDGAALHTTFHGIVEDHAQTDLSDAELDDKFTVQRFRVDAGSPDLHAELDGQWMRWDVTTGSWV